MMALRDAGVRSVPVVIYARRRVYDSQVIDEPYFIGQKWGDTKARGGFYGGDMVPISYAHLDRIKEEFGQQSDVMFSERRLSDDLEQQQQFLTNKATAAGYTDIDDWAANDINGYVQAAQEWREKNPAEVMYSTRRFAGTRTRYDYLVPDTPHYLNSDDIDLAYHDGLPIRITVGRHEKRFGMDHLYKNGMRDGDRAVEPVDGDVGEGHIRDLMRTLKYANQEFPGENGKVTLRSGLVSKLVVLQKQMDTKRGEQYWAVITTSPASNGKMENKGKPRTIDRPRLVDPSDSVTLDSYFKSMPDYRPKARLQGSLNSEWFDVTNPDGQKQVSVTVKPKRTIGPKESRPRLIGNSGRQYTPEQQAMFQKTGRIVDEKTILERLKEWISKRWQQGIFDQFAPFRGIDKQAYTLMRLSKGATGAFEAFMKHGKLSLRDGAYDADTSGGVINDVFVPLGRETTDFLYWIAGNRAERLAAEGKERLYTPAEIAAAKSLASGTTDFDYTLSNGQVTRDRTKIYADSLKKFNEYNKNVMDMAEQSGLIDGAARHLWEHEFYVPFYRVMEDDELRGMGIKKGIVRQEAFKKLKGGEEKLGDLLSNTLMNWAHLIDASSKNRAAKAAVEAAARVGIAAPAVQGEKQTVWFLDNGQKKLYRISDSSVMEAITGLEYSGMHNMIMDVLTKPKHWLTVGVTASPFFKVRNLIRDSVQAIATSDLSYNAIGNVVEGYKLTNRDRQEYVSALAGGGLIRFGTMLEGNEAARTRQLIKQGSKDAHILDGEGKLRQFYDKFLEPAVSAYNEIGNRGEEINRMSLYNQLIKQGVDHATASLMARDLLDFSLQGSFTTIRFLAQVVPFFQARLNGLYKLGRATKENREHMAVVIFASSLLSLALLAAYGDDDDWKKREEWDRDNYWWFKFAGIAFRIPRPFEVGAVATMVERTAEYAFTKEMTGERFRKVIKDLLANQLSMNPIPQAVKPIVDLYANKDSFTGRPIESMAMGKVDSEHRYTQNTWLSARYASSAIGGALSPVQIEHLVRGYFAWMGAFSIGAADMATRAMSDEPTKPALDAWKFATGGMVSEVDSATSRYVTQVYDQAKVLEEAYGTWRKLQKEGKTKDAKEYQLEHKEELGKYKRVEDVKRRLAVINERIRMIERSDKHPAEKRILIRDLKVKQNDISKQLSI
jgi:hypothetical protein